MSQASPVPGFKEPGSNERALEEVRDFWNADPCGSRYLGDRADFEAHARARYQLEPYIHEFAGFAQSGGQRVLEVGVLAGAGTGPCKPLNPTWDAEFMAMLRNGEIGKTDAWETSSVREIAGRGGNEALCWIAAFGALSTAGPYTIEQEFYEAIPGWIAGFATMAARPATVAC